MPPPRQTPGTDGHKPIPGGRVDAERSFDRWGRGVPLNTPSPPASVLLGRIHQKRPGDGADDGKVSNKRRRLSSTIPGSSPLVSDRGVLSGSGQRTPVIDLTDDAPEVDSSDSTRRIKSTTNTFLDSPPREAQSAPRYGPPSLPSTPTPGAKRKIETIDLTLLPDSDDDQSAPSTARPKKTTQAVASENVIGSTNANNPVRPEPFAGPSHQRSEPNHGQARPANLVQQKGATVLAQAQTRMRPSKLRAAFQPGQFTNGSPAASKNMTAPIKSAPLQEDTEKALANGSMSVVHQRKAAKDQLRRGYTSIPRGQVQDRIYGTRKTGGETKNADRKGAAHERVDVGEPDGRDSDLDSDEDRKLLKTDRSKKQPLLLRRPPPDTFARNKPLTGSFTFQARGSDAAYSVQARNRGTGGHQAIETGSIGEDDGSSACGESSFGVSVGAREFQKPLVLMNQGQAEKQSERVAHGRADGSNKRGECSSNGLFLEIGRSEDTRDELAPPTPRGSRRRRHMLVVLSAPPDELRRISQRPVQRPDVPVGKDKCWLIMVPLEIQHRIYKYLLLADDPIQVLHGWAKLYQRQRSNLHPTILQTCRTIYQNASEVLYGGNVFRYMVRDRPKLDALSSFGQGINVEKYVPLFRKLELKIERSRTEHAYCTSLANAIHLLNTHDAKLHTLTLDVSPSVEGDTLSTAGYFYRNGEIIQALKTLRTCFIVVRVLTPKTDDHPATSLRRELDLRRGEKAPNQPPEAQLDDLSEMITRACENPSKVVEQGWFEEFEVVPLQNERRARLSRMAYYDQNDDDDDDADDVSSTDENDDGDNSGEYRG